LTQTVVVPILNDAVYEGSETYTVNLSAASNASIADGTGQGTILDDGTGGGGADDDTPTLSVSDVSVTEGTDPHAAFTVSLSNPSVEDVSFTLALASGTATVGTDTGAQAALEYFDGAAWQTVAGAITIAAGQTSVQVRSAIVDDNLSEASEDFTLTATVTAGASSNAADTGTATIADDDGVPSLSLSGPAVIDEAAGTVTYTVSLSNPSASTVTVDYASSNGTATAGS